MLLDPAAALTRAASQSWRRIRTVDAHTGGEQFRVVVEGDPVLPGDSILPKRRWGERLAGFSTMCGPGIIPATQVALQTGMFTERADRNAAIDIDSPASLIRARPLYTRDSTTGVAFRKAPSFVVDPDAHFPEGFFLR